MKNTKQLLELLNQLMPPGEGQRHNITLNTQGCLEVCLMLGEYYVPYTLEEEDLEISTQDLVDAIHRLQNLGV